jgi:hypothetical protein
MSRQRAHHPSVRRRRYGAASDDLHAPAFDLYDYGLPPPSVRPDRHIRQAENKLADWVVTDDWPEHIPVNVVIVHSFSRFFRDHFEMEFYVRKLAKNGVKLLSITQEIGDDPIHR